MKKSKVLTGALALTMLTGVTVATGCSVSEKDGIKWAQENGYVKAEDYNIVLEDATASATASGVGGLNFGDVDWTEDLKKAAIKEYLKGDNSNYREMYSVATSYNNMPSIANVEYVLNTTSFELFGGSEKNTEKLNELTANPNVSLYWTRQLREADTTKSYFQSYGVQIDGTVKFYDYAKLTGDDRVNFIATARNYFKTMGAQYARFYDSAAANYMDDDALIAYFTNAGTVYYSIVPTKIVITSPYMLFVSYKEEGDKYVINAGTAYEADYEFYNGEGTSFLSKAFLDSLLARVREVKGAGTSYLVNPSLNAGLKTQATLNFNK